MMPSPPKTIPYRSASFNCPDCGRVITHRYPFDRNGDLIRDSKAFRMEYPNWSLIRHRHCPDCGRGISVYVAMSNPTFRWTDEKEA